jgi:hypothetical protein
MMHVLNALNVQGYGCDKGFRWETSFKGSLEFSLMILQQREVGNKLINK